MSILLNYNIVSNSTEIGILLAGSGNATIIWDDGNSDTYTLGGITQYSHTYASSGAYLVDISVSGGNITQLGNGNGSTGIQYLTSVTSFGNVGLVSISLAGASGLSNINCMPTTIPNTVTNLSYMFRNSNFNDSSIVNWDVSNVTNMINMFDNANLFNQNLNNWDFTNVTSIQFMFSQASAFNNGGNSLNWNTVNVTSMPGMFQYASSFNQNVNSLKVSTVGNFEIMFYSATAFNNNGTTLIWDLNTTPGFNITMAFMFSNTIFNQDIIWNTINVTNMTNMFLYTYLFNQPIGDWNVSNVQNMSGMFNGATAFNQNISNWNVGNVFNMSAMFAGATAFNQDLSWNVQNVQYMGTMFRDATSFNGDISNWNVQNVRDMSYMFYQATSFNRNIKNWDVGKVTNLFQMFYYATTFNQDLSWNIASVNNMNEVFFGATSFNGNIRNWNVQNIQSMSKLFLNATAFNQDLSNWNVGNVTFMGEMFRGASSFNGNISNWDVQKVTNMIFMFSGASSFNVNISNWNVQNVENIEYMFYQATSFNQDIGNWNIPKVQSTYRTFREATAFNQDLSWNTSIVNNMGEMFYQATSFNGDISNWNVQNVQYMNQMFYQATAFNQDISNWNVQNVRNMNQMFYQARAFAQDISNWNVQNVQYMNQMFEITSMGTNNFDKLINSWSLLPVQPNVTFTTITFSSVGQPGYNTLVSKNWYIQSNFVTYIPEIVYTKNFTFTYSQTNKNPIPGNNYILKNDSYPTFVISTYTALPGDTNYVFSDVYLSDICLNTVTIYNSTNNNSFLDSINIMNEYIQPIICFKEDSKILCFKDDKEQYIPIQKLRKGDLVKTHLSGYVPINMIGTKKINNPAFKEKITNQLYVCSKNKFPELFEDLVITGWHSILVNNFLNEEQKKQTLKLYNGKLYVTEKKYRLPACVHHETEPYKKEGFFNVYHIALENPVYNRNYGVYANGLLVESCSKSYLKDYSNMKLID